MSQVSHSLRVVPPPGYSGVQLFLAPMPPLVVFPPIVLSLSHSRASLLLQPGLCVGPLSGLDCLSKDNVQAMSLCQWLLGEPGQPTNAGSRPGTYNIWPRSIQSPVLLLISQTASYLPFTGSLLYPSIFRGGPSLRPHFYSFSAFPPSLSNIQRIAADFPIAAFSVASWLYTSSAHISSAEFCPPISGCSSNLIPSYGAYHTNWPFLSSLNPVKLVWNEYPITHCLGPSTIQAHPMQGSPTQLY